MHLPATRSHKETLPVSTWPQSPRAVCRPFRGPRVMGLLICLLVFTTVVPAQQWTYPHPASLQILDGYQVLHLKGSPEELGRQHGTLAGDLVRRVLNDVIIDDVAASESRRRELYEGAMVMERYLPEAYRRELRALAEAAGVDYEPLVALQLFGDVRRADSIFCSSFAAFGPATKTGELVAGRNMDYWDNGASSYGAVILVYYPDEGIPFITVSWAGIINGWTAMNAHGLIASNNTAYGRADSLEGISTCFMNRKIVQFASTVEEGVRIIEQGPRACGTVTMVAGGTPPNAAQVEFDHDSVAVRRAEDGYVIATNSHLKLHREYDAGAEPYLDSRHQILRNLILGHYGQIDRTMNFAAARGVPMSSINLHSAVLFPADLTMLLSMGRTPACDYRYRPFRFTERGLIALNEPPPTDAQAP